MKHLILFKKWLIDRASFIIVFLMFFCFLDLFTTYLGACLGAFEINPFMRPLLNDQNWGSIILFKLAGTLAILAGFYYLYRQKENCKIFKLIKVEDRYYKFAFPNVESHNLEIFMWGVLITVSVMIVILNFITIVFLLG